MVIRFQVSFDCADPAEVARLTVLGATVAGGDDAGGNTTTTTG